jgi:hypothetical protein
MTEVSEATNPTSTTLATLTASECEYLLGELGIQTGIEERARDRAENMMNYLLTTIAAIIGAVLLVTEIKSNGSLVIFVGALLLFLFSVAAFYRLCRLCLIISKTKLSCYQIRKRMQDSGAMVPPLLITTVGEMTGFYPQMVRNLVVLMCVCSFLAGLTFILGYALLKDTFHILQVSINNDLPYFIIAGTAGFALTFTLLWAILRTYRKWADELPGKK